MTTGKDKVHVDQFSQFQSVRVLVPPQSKLVCITEQESLAAEKFRFLGVRLRHLQQKHPLKRVLVTSSMAEEGKTTTAANLACVLARGNRRRRCCWREISDGRRWPNSLVLEESPVSVNCCRVSLPRP